MTRMSTWMVLAGLVLATAPPGVAGPPTVAVVNIPQVSEKYAKTADLESQFDALRRKLGQDRDAMKEKIERANRSLQEELKPGTDEFRQRRKEIALMEAELQWFVENEGQKVERGLSESLKSIYSDIQAAVTEVAKEKSIDIVLAADHLPPDTPDSPQQVRQLILLQKVLYWNATVDITEQVISKVNASYKKPSSSAGPISIDSVQIKPKEPAAPPKKP